MIKSIIVCRERGIFAGTFGEGDEPVWTSDPRMAVQTVPVFSSRERAKEICDDLLELDCEYGIFDVEVPENVHRIGCETMVKCGLEQFVQIMFTTMMPINETKH